MCYALPQEPEPDWKRQYYAHAKSVNDMFKPLTMADLDALGTYMDEVCCKKCGGFPCHCKETL